MHSPIPGWSPPSPLSQGSADAVAALLRDAITVGDLAPGAPLRQDHVAAKLGVSHIPVREAFRLLAAERLVVARPNRGVAVAPIAVATVSELTDLRALLEPDLLRHAAPLLSPRHLSAASAVLDRLEAADAASGRLRLAEAFHATLYEAADRPFFMEAVLAARRNLARCWRVIWDRGGLAAASQHDHRVLLNLLRRGRGEEAACALAGHIRESGAAVIAAFGNGMIG